MKCRNACISSQLLIILECKPQLGHHNQTGLEAEIVLLAVCAEMAKQPARFTPILASTNLIPVFTGNVVVNHVCDCFEYVETDEGTKNHLVCPEIGVSECRKL